MRTLIPVLSAVLAFVFLMTTSPACNKLAPVGPAAGSAATCELGVLEQTVTNGSVVETIGAEIFSAIATGGATLPALLDTLVATLAPGSAQCAALIADALETAFESSGSGTSFSTSDVRRAGHAVLRSEIQRRGWH
jgi:hypothetical protein